MSTVVPRTERHIRVNEPRLRLVGQRILITGAAGEIGQRLTKKLREWGITVIPTDIDTSHGPWGVQRMDINRFEEVLQVVNFHEPDLIINCASQKLAPLGELNPWQTIQTSVLGVQNLLNMGRKVVHVGTCKAADPEVAYGMGKACAEKLVLNAGGTVARLYNVPTAGPSMLTIWRDLPEDEALPVMPCWRYMITTGEAQALVFWSCVLEPGRYTIDPDESVYMPDYAEFLHPGRAQELVKPRRGDRIREPLAAECEHWEETRVPYIKKVVSQHDA